MSDYYDLNKPFSITNWNDLLEDVNEILENPPEGTNCEPIEAIELVEDPHVWSTENVEEVRDKLIKTCPDIEFKEELELWRPEIIDEIEEQMEEAWCHCSGEPDEFEVALGTFTCIACNAVMNTGQQGLVEGPISPVCQKVHTQYIYGGTWYPHIDNSALLDILDETFGTIYEAVRLFLIEMNQLPEIGGKIESYQRQCDYFTGMVDADIARVQEDRELLDELGPRICANGQMAREYQDKVDEQVEAFEEHHTEAVVQKNIADSPAERNQQAALQIIGRFPPDRNLILDAAGSIPDWNWYDWWDPEEMDRLSKYFNHQYNSVPWNTKRDGVYTSLHIQIKSNIFGTTIKNIRYSPDGTWYISKSAAEGLIRDYTKPYYDYQTRHRCESILGTTCLPEPGNCQWYDWEDHGQIWWYDHMGAGHFLFSNLAPDLWWKTHSEEVCTFDAKRPAGAKNNASKRDQWFDEHLNWYDKHEQYDDRHQGYC